MANYCYIDFETRSAVDLVKHGSDIYAQDDTTDVLCLAYAFDDEKVKVWLPHQEQPHDLLDHVVSGGQIVGHNIGGFEILIWNYILSHRHGWPELKIEQCEDTMAMAYAMAMPGSLNDASMAAGIAHAKDMAGHKVMLQLCKPKTGGGWWDKKEFKDKYEALYKYCAKDVEVERELHKRLVRLSAKEKKAWELDWRINRKGVLVDTANALKAAHFIKQESELLDFQVDLVTRGDATSAREVAEIRKWLKTQGVSTSTLSKNDVARLLDGEVSETVRTVLNIRKQTGKTSIAKIESMIKSSGHDDRMRGLFQYHGASTGRFSGRRVQLQNLPRSRMSEKEIEEFFKALESTKPGSFLLSELKTKYTDPMSAISEALRSFIKAADGYELLGGDFSSIEARVLAWLSGSEKVLDIFRGDGKIYEHAASSIYNVPVDQVTPDQRQIGKVAVLALGYGGGKGAFKTMAQGYGLEISDIKAEDIKTAWRSKHPEIVNYWAQLERAALFATQNQGKKASVGPEGRSVCFLRKGSFLWCQLPSKRNLCYPYPVVLKQMTPWDVEKDTLNFKGVNGVTRKWEQTSTYGGKLCENVTQAVARDVMVDTLLRLEAANLDAIMHVHDEIIIEAKRDTVSVSELENLFCKSPEWAKDLPISAKCWKGFRYQK